MDDIAEKIVYLLQKNSSLSTTHIIASVYPKEYQYIAQLLEDPYTTKEVILLAKRRKEQLHRRILYHLNKLLEKHILVVHEIGAKGQKKFSLKDPVRGKEQVQAVLINLRYTSKELLSEVLGRTKDAIGVVGLEFLTEEKMNFTVQQLVTYATTTQTHVTFFIQPDNLRLCLSIEASSYIHFALGLTKELLQTHEEQVRTFLRKTQSLYIQHLSVHAPPFILGERGPYTIAVDQWKEYLRNPTAGICYCQSEILIERNTYSSMRSVVLQKAQEVVKQNALQRVDEKLLELCKKGIDFGAAIDHIRLAEEETEFVQSCREQVKELSYLQQNVFRSCGLPSEFQVVLSAPYFPELTLSHTMQLEEHADSLLHYQNLCFAFNYQFCLSLRYTQSPLAILQFLFHTTPIPLFKFISGREENARLTAFI